MLENLSKIIYFYKSLGIYLIMLLMNARQTMPIHDDSATPLIFFRDVWFEGAYHSFEPDDTHSLLILEKSCEKKVSYERAFKGWKNSSHQSGRRFEGRSFFQWMNKHNLSILWSSKDFYVNPILTSPNAPKHDPDDEFAKGLSFTICPQMVDGRKIKLYVQDHDMIKILNLHFGEKESLTTLTQRYISQRLQWQRSCIPAPAFVDWMIANGKRPHITEGELGFSPQVSLG